MHRVALAVVVAAAAAGCASAPPPPRVVEHVAVRVFTHCDLWSAEIRGDRWVADDHPAAPPDPVAPDGTTTVGGYVDGTATPSGGGWSVTAPGMAGAVVFRPAGAGDPLCE